MKITEQEKTKKLNKNLLDGLNTGVEKAEKKNQ